MLDDPDEPLPRRQIALSGDPKHPQASVPARTEFRRAGSDALITRNHDEATCGHGRHPVWIQHAERALRHELMPDADRVPSRRDEGMSETEGTLVDLEAEAVAISRHQLA
jgi:hypothetical protein